MRGAGVVLEVAAPVIPEAPVDEWVAGARSRRFGLPTSWLLAVAFAGIYGVALLRKHAQYQTFAYDLGLLTQATWNSAHGRPFATTLLAFNYLADHASPVLLLAAPLLLLRPDARVLLLVQALAVAAAGVGVFLVARRRTQDTPAALLVQAAYHLAPATAWVALDEFHPIALALPAVAFATACFWEGRIALAALLAGLALPFGLLLALTRRGRGRQRHWGLALTAGTAAWLLLYLGVIAPHLRPAAITISDPHPDIGVLIYCGRTWRDIAGCLVTRPDLTLHQLLRPEGRAALAALLGPTGGLGLLGLSFLVIVPRWVIHLLSPGPGNYAAHYAALMAVAAWLATAEALGWLGRRVPLLLRRRLLIRPSKCADGAAPQAASPSPALLPSAITSGRSARTTRLLAAVVAMLALLAFHAQSPLLGAFRAPPPAVQARLALLDRAVALVPADPSMAVTVTSSILPHLAARRRLFLPWADPSPPSDYVVLDLRDAYPLTADALRARAARWRADPGYQILLDQDDILVLRRGAMPAALPRHDLFGGVILLQSDRLTADGSQLRVQLFWHAQAPIAGDYHYFVHLVDASGASFSQQDGTLEEGRLATPDWSPGTTIRETLRLPAPPPAQWGRSHLEVGWYDWRSGRRLTLPDGSDHASLPLPS